MATYASIFAWKITWTEEPGGLQSMGLQRVGRNWMTKNVGTLLSELETIFFSASQYIDSLFSPSPSPLSSRLLLFQPFSLHLVTTATSHHGQIILHPLQVQPAPVWCPVLQMRDWRPAKYFLSWDNPETLLHKWEMNPHSVTLISVPLIKTLLTFLVARSRMWVGCVGSGACLWLISEQCLKYLKVIKFNQRDC